MKDMDLPAEGPRTPGWGSDVAAQMLRALGIKYLAINPGASYRGLHDSVVNLLGNRDPQMLLCMHEDHVISIAHGYAKVNDEMMGAVLHSNVGLMHGLMGIFNAWCDRMPVLVIGATGPVAPEKRRPWIDWIHSAKDQGALLRNFSKWDDEPRSPGGIVDAFLRAAQASRTTPRGPSYVCLDAALQEQALDQPVAIPDVARFQAPPEPSASAEQLRQAAGWLAGAEKPVILMGRVSRRPQDWDLRVRLAETAGASVLTSIRERSSFPTEHPLHAATPMFWVSQRAKQVLGEADLIVALDWPDLNGTLQQVSPNPAAVTAKIVHVSLDHAAHNGWSLDSFATVPADMSIAAGADTFVAQLLPELQAQLGSRRKWQGENRNVAPELRYSADAAQRIAPRDVEVALAKLRGKRLFSLAHVALGWAGDAYHFRDPLDWLGHDGGAGLSACTGLTVGAALALKDSGRRVVAVMGDGDFMQGATALWTAARYKLPALFIVSNNRSNFNDEIHQETVAKVRARPVENRWIGMRIDDPALDIAGLARAQGVEAEGPVENVAELEAAIERGLAVVAAGRPYLIDAHVTAGYAATPLARAG